MAAALLLPGCGDAGSAAAGDADAGDTAREPAARSDAPDAGEDDAAAGPEDAEPAADADGAAAPVALDAGSAGDAASAQPDVAQPDAAPPALATLDLSGTWISKIETLATESVPLVGEIDVRLELAIRLLVTHTGDQLSAKFDICRLTTETIPDPALLVVSFPPALIETLTGDASTRVSTIAMGDMVPIPQLTIRSGIDASEQPVDADADSLPGVTVPANIGGLLPLRVYTGLTVQADITARLSAEDEITGSASFGVTGSVLGSDTPLLSEGTLTVVPKSGPVPLTATRLDGDVPCSEVVTRLP